MSESIFATMKELTLKGRIVMASVHTPSSEMCQQFTHVLLLTYDGRLAYHGRQDQAIKYFQNMG
jgi:ABC-type multidrug transport system ATPase subunit